ncbi:MAG TPA: flagellar filament capping protein FliD [Solirubrobacteraceae bacterium]|nr:flagellar filament capping protein FliD [Solirubrobacteraceae bacterium]
MSSSPLSVGSTSGAPITVQGLASGLETSAIINALMQAEREPVTHLSAQQAKVKAAESELQSVQSALQTLAQESSELALSGAFESKQQVSSNEPARVSATASDGAAVGGYEVQVTQLANSAQRTFAFTSPGKASTISIDGQEFNLSAGETAKQLASAVNGSSSATVYAVVLEDGDLVLSDRATGKSSEFIQVSGEALTEVAGTAREGRDAIFKIDGVEGSSSSNTVTDAIPGVTLTLGGLTSNGPVTIDVQPPGLEVSGVEAKLQAFIQLYNSTVETIQTQLATRPPANPSSSEYGVGTLFADPELTNLLDDMRASMYEPLKGLEAEMSSPFDIGVSTGAPSGGGASQSSLEGLLTLEPAKLAEAIQANPSGVQKMLAQFSQGLQLTIEDVSAAGGTMEARINGDASQVTQLQSQISSLDEILLVREKALQETYAQLEGVLAQNTNQDNYLIEQAEALSKAKG